MKISLVKITKKTKSAFSLIELSIVILIIGILVAGVSQASVLVEKYRVKTATNLTNNSPLKSMKGVEFWLETANYESFDLGEEVDNNFIIQNWRNLDQVSSVKNNATSPDLENRPIYQTNCIKSLPCLSFDGIDDYIEISLGENKVIKEFTLFMLVDFDINNDMKEYSSLLMSSDLNADFSQIAIASFLIGENFKTLQSGVNHAGDANVKGSASSVSDKTRPFLITVQEKDDGTRFLFRVNKENMITDTPAIAPGGIKNISTFVIGATNGYGFNFQGKVGEVIFINRNLKAQELIDIENYLFQKWKII